MAAPKPGITRGRVVNTPWGSRVYYKPKIRKVVFRIPWVTRRSEKVIARNMKLHELAGSPNHPVTACRAEYLKEHPGAKHVPIEWMRDCLSKRMATL